MIQKSLIVLHILLTLLSYLTRANNNEKKIFLSPIMNSFSNVVNGTYLQPYDNLYSALMHQITNSPGSRRLNVEGGETQKESGEQNESGENDEQKSETKLTILVMRSPNQEQVNYAFQSEIDEQTKNVRYSLPSLLNITNEIQLMPFYCVNQGEEDESGAIKQIENAFEEGSELRQQWMNRIQQHCVPQGESITIRIKHTHLQLRFGRQVQIQNINFDASIEIEREGVLTEEQKECSKTRKQCCIDICEQSEQFNPDEDKFDTQSFIDINPLNKSGKNIQFSLTNVKFIGFKRVTKSKDVQAPLFSFYQGFDFLTNNIYFEGIKLKGSSLLDFNTFATESKNSTGIESGGKLSIQDSIFEGLNNQGTIISLKTSMETEAIWNTFEFINNRVTGLIVIGIYSKSSLKVQQISIKELKGTSMTFYVINYKDIEIELKSHEVVESALTNSILIKTVITINSNKMEFKDSNFTLEGTTSTNNQYLLNFNQNSQFNIVELVVLHCNFESQGLLYAFFKLNIKEEFKIQNNSITPDKAAKTFYHFIEAINTVTIKNWEIHDNTIKCIDGQVQQAYMIRIGKKELKITQALNVNKNRILSYSCDQGLILGDSGIVSNKLLVSENLFAFQNHKMSSNIRQSFFNFEHKTVINEINLGKNTFQFVNESSLLSKYLWMTYDVLTIGNLFQVNQLSKTETDEVNSKVNYLFAKEASQIRILELNIQNIQLTYYSSFLYALHGSDITFIESNFEKITVDPIKEEDEELKDFGAIFNGIEFKLTINTLIAFDQIFLYNGSRIFVATQSNIILEKLKLVNTKISNSSLGFFLKSTTLNIENIYLNVLESFDNTKIFKMSGQSTLIINKGHIQNIELNKQSQLIEASNSKFKMDKTFITNVQKIHVSSAINSTNTSKDSLELMNFAGFSQVDFEEVELTKITMLLIAYNSRIAFTNCKLNNLINIQDHDDDEFLTFKISDVHLTGIEVIFPSAPSQNTFKFLKANSGEFNMNGFKIVNFKSKLGNLIDVRGAIIKMEDIQINNYQIEDKSSPIIQISQANSLEITNFKMMDSNYILLVKDSLEVQLESIEIIRKSKLSTMPFLSFEQVSKITIDKMILKSELPESIKFDQNNVTSTSLFIKNCGNFLTIQNSHLEGFVTNKGALFVQSGEDIDLINVTMKSNKQMNNENLGGAGLRGLDVNRKISIVKSNFTSNMVINQNEVQRGFGGAIYLQTSSKTDNIFSLSSTEISHNIAPTFGGGIYLTGFVPKLDQDSVNFNNNTIKKNHEFIKHDIGSNGAFIFKFSITNTLKQGRLLSLGSSNAFPQINTSQPILNITDLSTGSEFKDENQKFKIVDVFGQQLTYDSSSILVFHNEEKDKITVFPNSFRAQNGIFNLEDAIFKHQKNSLKNLKFSSNGIIQIPNLERHFPIKVQEEILLQFTECKQFEITQSLTDQCQSCPPGRIPDDISGKKNSKKCIICDSEKMICQGQNNYGVKDGYWVLNQTSSNYIECYPKQSCIGSIKHQEAKNLAQIPYQGMCSNKKYYGNVCNECSDGYAKTYDGKDCYSCKNIWKPIIRMVLFIVIFTFVFSMGFKCLINLEARIDGKRNTSGSNSSSHIAINKVSQSRFKTVYTFNENERMKLEVDDLRIALIRMFISHFQSLGILMVVNIPWDTFVNIINRFDEAFTIIHGYLFFFDCAFNSKEKQSPSSVIFLKILLANMLLIILIVILISILSVIKTFSKTLLKAITLKQLALKVLLLVFYINIVSLVRLNAQALDCKNLYSKNYPEYYLRLSTNTQCWTQEHKSWALGLSLTLVILFGFFLPFISFLVQFRNVIQAKNSRLSQQSIKIELQSSWLSIGFRNRRFYWEYIIHARKMLLLICILLASIESEILQIYMTVYIILISIIMHIRIKPYYTKALNRLELISLIVQGSAIMQGVFFSTLKFESGANLFVVIVGTFLYVLFIINWSFAYLPQLQQKILAKLLEKFSTLEMRKSKRFNFLVWLLRAMQITEAEDLLNDAEGDEDQNIKSKKSGIQSQSNEFFIEKFKIKPQIYTYEQNSVKNDVLLIPEIQIDQISKQKQQDEGNSYQQKANFKQKSDTSQLNQPSIETQKQRKPNQGQLSANFRMNETPESNQQFLNLSYPSISDKNDLK